MGRSRKPRKSSAQSRRTKGRRRHAGETRSPLARLLRVEALEDRRMLAVITVTSLADNLFPGGGVTLREAIQAANTDMSVDGSVAGDDMNDTIVFDAVLAGETITLGGADLEITEAVTIDATALTNNVTIDADNASRIFNISAATGDFTLAGLTLTGGRTTGDNVVPATTFSGGAVLSLTTGSLTIDQSTVSGNSTMGGFADGGGIFSSGAVTLTSSTVNGNSTAGNFADGGGIFSFETVTLTSSTVSGNGTAGSSADGGGIFSSGTVTLTSSTVSGNSTAGSYGHGGGIRSSSAVTLTSSTVSGNSTAGFGADGGGIRSFGAVTLTSSTVTDNHATYSNATGGGIWNFSGTITLTHSILAGNTAGGGSPDIDPGTGVFAVDFSLLGTVVTPDAGGSGNVFEDTPLLGPLAGNGGPTETHALLAGSLAIDAGSPGYDVVATPTDQRGAPFARGVGLRVDIGAYERQTVAGLNLTVDTNLDENNGDYSAGDLSLREAVGLANGSVGVDTILFGAARSGDTIRLGGADIQITEAVTIDATALAQNVTIDANLLSRIFNITATTGDFTLAGLTLTGGRTTGNNAGSLGTTFSGGAVRSLTTGSLTIDQSTVSGNSTAGSSADGGGIFSIGAITLTSSTVSGNSTVGSSAIGGGIHSSSAITLTSSTVSGNSTAGYLARGGGIFSLGAATLTSSTVSGNSTVGYLARGGGIRSSGAVTLTSSTVSGNSTAGDRADGGGIFSSGAVTLTSSTVTDNHAYYSNATGGGIWNNNDTITLTHSILAGNTAGGGSPDIDPGTGIFAVDFSLIGDNEGTGLSEAQAADTNGNLIGTNVNPIDPLLGALADNGGPTETHALLADSPAIDAGDPSFAPPPNFDQRGAPFVRVFDGDGMGGPRIDMGAYERQTVAGLNLVVDMPTDENDGDYSVGDLSLRESVGLANGSVGADTITFDAVVFATPQTMALELGEMVIGEAVTLNGPGQQLLTIDAQQQSRIIHITATTGDLTIAGLTLTGGRTNESGSAGEGGAIRSLTTGNLTLDQSTVSGNSTEGNFGSGGGISAAGDVTLIDSTVSGNSATGSGGGIFTRGGVGIGNVTLTGSTVSGNSTSGYEAHGGGIAASVIGEVTLTRSTVSGNSTSGERSFGGGIYAKFGDVLLVQSTVSNNYTTGLSAEGGGIVANATVSLTLSTVSGNHTSGDDISGGAGIIGSAMTLNYSTVTDNHVDYISANGGGIRSSNGTFVISGSIVAGNTAGGGLDDIDPGIGTLSVNFSLIGTTVAPDAGTSGNNVVSDVPMLGSLTDNGGPTETHALLAGSPAIDAGDPNFTTPPNFDQRGAPFTRVFGGRIDIGSVEDQPQSSSADFDTDGDIDGRDFLFWQRGFGTPAATKADGDADNDTDVDGDDLDIWEGQFGGAAPIVAAASALNFSEPVAGSLLTASDLVDVALAVALADRTVEAAGARGVGGNSQQLGLVSKPEPNPGVPGSDDRASQLDDEVPEASAYGSHLQRREDERGSPGDASAWEDALDEVFASVFG